jgi:hypothetical protein
MRVGGRWPPQIRYNLVESQWKKSFLGLMCAVHFFLCFWARSEVLHLHFHAICFLISHTQVWGCSSCCIHAPWIFSSCRSRLVSSSCSVSAPRNPFFRELLAECLICRCAGQIFSSDLVWAHGLSVPCQPARCSGPLGPVFSPLVIFLSAVHKCCARGLAHACH